MQSRRIFSGRPTFRPIILCRLYVLLHFAAVCGGFCRVRLSGRRSFRRGALRFFSSLCLSDGSFDFCLEHRPMRCSCGRQEFAADAAGSAGPVRVRLFGRGRGVPQCVCPAPPARIRRASSAFRSRNFGIKCAVFWFFLRKRVILKPETIGKC